MPTKSIPSFLDCHQPTSVRNSGLFDPPITTNKQRRGILNRVVRCDLFNSPPRHPILCCCTRSSVIELCVKQSLQSKCALPCKPPLRLDQVVDLALHHHGSRIQLPWATEEGLDSMANGVVVRVGRDLAVLEDNTGGFFSLGSALGGDKTCLTLHWLPHEDLTVL